jgi:hypothetical protein
MGVMCDYLQDTLVNNLFRGGAFSPPGTIYVALHSADPGSNGNANEITGMNYVRAPIATTLWNAPTAGSGTVTLNTDVLFPIAGNDWGAVNWITLKSAATAGNSWMSFQVPDGGRTVHSGDRFRLVAGNFSVGLT